MKMMIALFLCFANSATASAFEPTGRPITDAAIRQNYRDCQMILQAAPTKLEALYQHLERVPNTRGLFRNAAGLREHCRKYNANGLPRLLQLNREYNDWYYQRGKFKPRPSRPSRPSRGGVGGGGGSSWHRESGRVNCYSQNMSCVGSSVTANSPSQCPSGTSSYAYDNSPHNCHQ